MQDRRCIHLGLQLEYLLLRAIGVLGADITADGPYRQSAAAGRKGCQVDYPVQTVTDNLYVCEFKFTRRGLGGEIIDEMRDKMGRLQTPKGFAAVPVLFHLGTVSDAVAVSGYFYRIIDLAVFLEEGRG